MLVIQAYEEGPRTRIFIDLTAIPPEAHKAGVVEFSIGTRDFRLLPDEGVRSCRLTFDAPPCVRIERDRQAQREFLARARAAYQSARARVRSMMAAALPTAPATPTPKNPAAVAAGHHIDGPLTGHKESE